MTISRLRAGLQRYHVTTRTISTFYVTQSEYHVMQTAHNLKELRMLPAERKESERTIKSNQHELIIISFEEMDNVIKSLPKAKRVKAQSTWESIKAPANFGANYYATATDVVKAQKLISDLGGFTTKVHIKVYGGKPHIILKGNHKLRTILTANRYGIKNPKIIKMGIGREAVLSGVKSGGVMSIVLISIYRVLDYIFTDEQTMFQFVGALAVDIVKIGIVVGISFLLAMAAGYTTFAIGTLVIVLIVGFIIGQALNAFDIRFDITNRVIAALEEISQNPPSLDSIKTKVIAAVNNTKKAGNELIEEKKIAVSKAAGSAVGSVIDVFIDSAKRTAISIVRDAIRDSTKPYKSIH